MNDNNTCKLQWDGTKLKPLEEFTDAELSRYIHALEDTISAIAKMKDDSTAVTAFVILEQDAHAAMELRARRLAV